MGDHGPENPRRFQEPDDTDSQQSTAYPAEHADLQSDADCVQHSGDQGPTMSHVFPEIAAVT